MSHGQDLSNQKLHFELLSSLFYFSEKGCRDREGDRAAFFTLREGGGENNCYCLTNCDEHDEPNYYSSNLPLLLVDFNHRYYRVKRET